MNNAWPAMGDEGARLDALKSYEVMDTPPEHDLDRLVDLAARILDVPIALITLLDSERQFFKANIGMEGAETPRSISFCTVALEQAGVFVVPDAAKDPRFCSSPLVTGPSAVRFYAGAPLMSPDGHKLGMFCVMDHRPRDFSGHDRRVLLQLAGLAMERLELRRLMAARHRSIRRLQYIAETSPNGIICIADEGTITFWNSAATTIFGYAREEIMGQPYTRLIKPADVPRYARRVSELTSRVKTYLPVEPIVSEGMRADGTTFPMEISLSAWRERGEVVFAALVHDLTRAYESEKRLMIMASFDPLTELLTREAFQAHLTASLAAGSEGALILLDLDGFKAINDWRGHLVGDQVLATVAGRLKRLLGDSARVGRLGGDEFAIDLHRTSDFNAAAKIGREILESVHEPMLLDGAELQAGGSLGIAFYPSQGDVWRELMEHADLALYEAKNQGRNTLRFFLPELAEKVGRRKKMEFELQGAFEQGQFELYYQPLIDVPTRTLAGAEALLRWNHPVRGLLLPSEFMEVVEHSADAERIGTWVLAAACRQAATWRAHGLQDFRVAVNLFPRQLYGDGLHAQVQAIMRETGLPPQALELEITENTLLRPGPDCIAKLAALRNLGIGLALDDYGTGYASLSLLKRLPVTRLKIDRSFVATMLEHEGDAAVVRVVLFLGERFDLRVTAEGVESAAQLAALRALGCAEVQGYFCGKAATAEVFHAEQILTVAGGA